MNKVQKIVMCGILTALTAVATLISFPIPGTKGYVNLGDSVIFFTAFFFNPYMALIAGGIGSALADVILSYTVYAPFTLIIKGLEGLVAGILMNLLLNNAFQKNKFNLSIGVRFNACCFVGGLVMISGYFFTGVILYDLPMAVTEIPFNFLQLGASMLLATLLSASLFSIRIVRLYLKK